MILRMNGVMQSYPITAGFGSIDKVHTTAHTGIDLLIPTGTDILSPCEGIVSRIADYGNTSLGKAVFVKLDNGKELVFGHLSKINVKDDQIIHFGQKIAESGNTGLSTGAHLHLALKDVDGHFIDPQAYEQIFQTFDHSTNVMLAKVPSVFDLVNPFSKIPKPDLSIPNPFREVMEFFKPIVDFFSWCGGVVNNIKTEGFGDWLEHRLFLGIKYIFTEMIRANDFFFLLPAVLFMVFYFVVGKNRTTKFIIPLWFTYFLSQVLSIYLGN